MPLVVADPKRRTAMHIADQRQKRLIEYFEELPRDGAVRRFSEQSEESEIRDTEFVEGHDAASEISRLQWQMFSPHRLLLERATDVFERWWQGTKIPVEPGTITISLEPVPWHARINNLGRLPFRVKIKAPKHVPVASAFDGASDSLGVGVYVDGPAHLRPWGRCMVDSVGLDGVVGGMMKTRDGESFSITCQHVLSGRCQSLIHSGGSNTGPDAALLHKQSECFEFPSGGGRRVFPANTADIERYMSRRYPHVSFAMWHPACAAHKGWLRYPVSGTNHTGVFARYPLYSIRRARWKFGPFRWPMRQHGFAGPGDSGSWVCEKTGDTWLGMVVCGNDDDHDTLAADAQYLVDYFSRVLTGDNTPTPEDQLAPFVWRLHDREH